MSLRPYQQEALKASYDAWNEGIFRQLIQLPTGCGKTVVFASLPKHHGIDSRVLILVHREELAQQAAEKFHKWNEDYTVGIEMGSRRSSPLDRCVVASVQTIGRKGSTRIEDLLPETFGLVICDEVHHATSETYLNVFRRFGLYDDGGSDRQVGDGGGDRKRLPLLVGVTATPGRSDGTPLAKILDRIVYQMSTRKAVEDGWLAEPRGKKITTNTRLDSVKTLAGDFNLGDLERTVNTVDRNLIIVKGYIDHAWPRQTVAFCVDVQHAKDLARAFQANSIPAEAIWAGDPERSRKLAQHREGVLKVICNCGILTEGYDDWRIECIILARPTKSQLLFTQMAGRGTRIPEGINNLKEAMAAGIQVAKKDCLLLDVVDSTSKHSLITLSSLFGMAANMDLNGKSAVAAVRKIEQMQEEHPNVDFSTLTNIDNISTLVQEVNLWEVRFPEELENNTELAWHSAGPGRYVVLLPNKEKVTVDQDLLGKFTVWGTISGETFKEGGFEDLTRAVQFADMKLSTFGKQYINLLRRKAAWHDDPMTEPQERLLKKFYRGRPLPPNLSKGQAKSLISQHIAGRMR